MPRASRVLTVATLGALLVPSLARPQPSAVNAPPPAEIELDWDAPPQCPDDEALRARIEELLTGPPRGEGTVVVTGRIEPREAGLRLTLTTDFRGRIERRELDAPTCDELGEATAILLAIALEPELEEQLVDEPDSEASTVPEPTSPPEPDSLSQSRSPSEPAPRSEPEPETPLLDGLDTTPSADAPADPRPRRPPPRLALRLGVAGEAGALPGPTGGPRLALGLHWPRLRLEAHGGYLAPRLDATAGQGALYQAGVGGLRACGRPRVGPVELPVCGGAEGGAIRGSTRGFDPARTRHAPWLGPLVSTGVAYRFGRVGLWGALEAVAPVYRGEFVLAGEVGFGSFPVSGRVVLGLEIISNPVP